MNKEIKPITSSVLAYLETIQAQQREMLARQAYQERTLDRILDMLIEYASEGEEK